MARHEEQTQPGSKRQNESKWVKSVRGEGGVGRAEVSVGPLPFGLRLSIALCCDAFVPIFLSLSHSDIPLNRWRNEFLLGRTKELSLGRAGLALDWIAVSLWYVEIESG